MRERLNHWAMFLCYIDETTINSNHYVYNATSSSGSGSSVGKAGLYWV
jgi:hypothetical protein